MTPKNKNHKLHILRRRSLLALLLFCSVPARADALWVQAVAGGGFEARLMTGAPSCPLMHTANGDTAMHVRAAADAKFPLLCAAPMPIAAASIQGVALPMPVAAPQRILVLGDTGCRLKGAALQDCNTPGQWPFPQLAAAAAKLKPDLVVHLGDYLYRETPCPADDAGCAGSPYGDNGAAWAADFFTPAAPLLLAAPVVLVRGNHEECARAGPGWLRLLGPGDYDAGAPCAAHLPVYTLDMGAMRLAVLDDASASDTQVTQADLPAYVADIAALAVIPAPAWLLLHRPIWAAISGPLGIPVGGNRTLIAATDHNPIPPSVALMLSGHIHSFEALNYDSGVPPQIVAGNGGDNLDVTPRNLKGAIFQGHSGVSVRDGLSVGGFGFLLMTKAPASEPTGWIIDLYDSAANPTRRCRFTSPVAAQPGRLDCPAPG